MGKRIIYETEDGGIAVVIPSPEFLIDHNIEDLIGRDVPEGSNHKIVADSLIPSDRRWRNAWVFDNGSIMADSEKCRGISLDRIRQKRVEKFKETDSAYIKALATGDQEKLIAIGNDQQKLRDATEPLKAWVPAAPRMSVKAIESVLAELENLPI